MKKIAWFVPYPLEGSGGHRTIFQNVEALIDQGYECHIYIEDIGKGHNAQDVKSLIEKYFGIIRSRFYVGFNARESYDLIFATAWYTAKFVRDVPQDCKKAYFIQDFEPYFNPMGDGYLLAENSYKYNLLPVTIGKWLSKKMSSEFSTSSNYFDFCADKNVYFPMKLKREKAVCFIYQPEKPRRCNLIGIEALGIVKHLVPDVKIYLYGSKEKNNVWFEHENLELISIQDCNELYNKCSVGLCISSSNPSRIPFEMMAAGLPVVDLYRENNLFDLPDNCVSLADPTPESIAQAIIEILNDAEKQLEMSSNGVSHMKDKGLEDGYQQFVNAVNRMFEPTYNGLNHIEQTYNKPPVIADSYTHIASTSINSGASYTSLKQDITIKFLLRKIKKKLFN